MIELVVVIVILGVVATIAIPRMSNAAQTARTNAVTAQLNQYRRAFETYHAENFAWPPESATGTAPTQMTAYLDPVAFSKTTLIGGNWDWQNNGGDDVAIRIMNISSGDEVATEVNRVLDGDDDLDAGNVTVDSGNVVVTIGR